MKKIFLFAALALSASVFAQKSINWYSAIESNATKDGTVATAVGSNSLKSISAYSDGSVVVAGAFASCQLTPATATFMNHSFVGAPYTVNQTTSNNNLIISKISKNGTVQWLLHSNRGNGEAIAVATSDGGALVFATVTHTDGNVQGDNKNLQLYNGTDSITCAIHDFKSKTFQYGELIKIDANGQKAVIAGELLNQGTSNDFTAVNWSTDGTRYNLLLQVKKAVKFGETTITPSTGGSLVILQFNNTGTLTQYKVTDIPNSANSYVYGGNTTYVAGVATVDGESSLLMRAYNESMVLVGEDTIKGAKLPNGANVLQLKKILPSPDGKAMYLAGSVNGGLVIGADTLKNEEKKLHGFVVKYDFSTNKATSVYHHNTEQKISTFTDLFRFKDNLYVYGYTMQEMTGNGIIMVQLSDNLAPVDTLGLFITSGTETTWDAVEADGNIVLAANVAKGSYLTFTADNTKSVTATTLSRILASITLNDPVSTAIETIAPVDTKVQKIIRNGQVLIIHDGKVYNALGAIVE